MESISSTISVQVDSNDKELANNILKNLGLNMSTFVNMAIKQLIYTDGIPFAVRNPKLGKDFREVYEESEQIIKDLKSGKRKGYDNVYEMFKDLDEDIDNGRI